MLPKTDSNEAKTSFNIIDFIVSAQTNSSHLKSTSFGGSTLPNLISSILNCLNLQKKQKQTADEEKESTQPEINVSQSLERVTEDVIPTEPADLLDDDEKSIWSGFVTRNKQFRVCMMAYTVQGDNNEFYLPDRLYNLNVSLRANFEDVQKFESQG